MAFTGTTDSTGKVTIAVPAGTYTVSNTPPAGFTAAAPSAGVSVTAGATTSLTITDQAPAGSLAVTIVDQFGRIVAGALVSAS